MRKISDKLTLLINLLIIVTISAIVTVVICLANLSLIAFIALCVIGLTLIAMMVFIANFIIFSYNNPIENQPLLGDGL